MTRTNKTARTLSDSPLLNNDAESSVLHSTIHPERLDMSRFSDRMIEEEEEGSPLRIIIYVIVVIAIGVGLALGVRYLISQNNQNATQNPTNNNNQTTTTGGEATTTSPLVKVNTTTAADSTAPNTPKNEDFMASETAILGTGLPLGSKAALQEISYQKYTTFTRTTFTFKDLGGNNELPSAIIGFQPNNNRISIAFDANLNMPSTGINPTNAVNDLLRDITASLTEKQFVLQYSKSVEYRVAIVGNTLIVDAREKGTTTPTTTTGTDTTTTTTGGTTTTQPTTTGSDTGTNTTGGTTGGTTTTGGGTTTGGTTGTQPTGNNYKNDFSQAVQTISNTKITGNKIAFNETYYEDQGQYFEFALGERLKVGDAYIPNAKAEYTTVSGKNYIKLTIQNIADIQFQQTTSAELSVSTGISLENANFVSAKRESFSNGTVVIMFEVKRKADFRLVSEPTISGQTQVLALQIKD